MATDLRRRAVAEAMSSVERFSRVVLGRPLRAYQLEVAGAIHASVRSRRGLTFAVMMARQAGKNETSAHVEALLLNAHRRVGGFLVKAAPTFRPQAVTSLIRLQTILETSPLGRSLGVGQRLLGEALPDDTPGILVLEQDVCQAAIDIQKCQRLDLLGGLAQLDQQGVDHHPEDVVVLGHESQEVVAGDDQHFAALGVDDLVQVIRSRPPSLPPSRPADRECTSHV